jgi:pimeloyl-ACP methyl ester carboxylesterase
MKFAPHALREQDGKYLVTYDREVLRHFDAYDLRSLLKDVVCPALVIRGEESAVMSRQAAEEMCGAMPGGKFAEVPKAAHPVPADNPHAFAELVLGFLTGI